MFKKIIFIILSIFILTGISCAETIKNTSESNLTESEALSYKLMAEEYQKKADYYNSLIKNTESTIESKPVESEHNPFKGSQIGIGGNSVTGGGDNTNFSGNLIFNYDPDKSESGWSFKTLGQYDYLYSKSGGNEKNRLYLQQNGAYMADKYNGTFAQVSYLNDINNSYVYVWNENIGYQLQLMNNEDMNLAFNFGPGLQQREIVGSGYTQTLPQFLSQITYNLYLNKLLTFYEQLQNTTSPINNTLYSISQLNFIISNGFSIGVNYQITYNSNPSDNANPINSITSVQVNYGIN
ncbi:MAG: DUF481 domain-containing protein [Burkholderiales bacterium]|nr:DUF481 domain-containing protein [Burkholderiales bacterium]